MRCKGVDRPGTTVFDVDVASTSIVTVDPSREYRILQISSKALDDLDNSYTVGQNVFQKGDRRRLRSLTAGPGLPCRDRFPRAQMVPGGAATECTGPSRGGSLQLSSPPPTGRLDRLWACIPG